MFFLFRIFVALWLLLYCFWYWPVLFWYPFWLRFPGFWRNQCKFFELLKEELHDWKEVLDVEKSFLFAVTFFFFFGKSSPKRNSESAVTFILNAWYWLSRQYAIWSHLYCSRSVFIWLSSASESVQSWTIVLKFLLRGVVFKFLLFFNSSNALVTLEIAPKRNCASFVFSDLWIWFLIEAFHSRFLYYIFWFLKNLNFQVEGVFLICEPVFPYLLC